MKKNFCLFLFACFTALSSIAQLKEDKEQNNGVGKSNSLSLGPDIPFAYFSDTHKYGAGLNYSWSSHLYGILNALPKKLIGFTLNSGVDYYFGKKENVSGFNYRYDKYIYLHAYGGAIYNPCTKGNISLTAGPALSLYRSNTQFNFGANLEGSYFFNKNFAIAAAVTLMKESDSDILVTASLRGVFVF